MKNLSALYSFCCFNPKEWSDFGVQCCGEICFHKLGDTVNFEDNLSVLSSIMSWSSGNAEKLYLQKTVSSTQHQSVGGFSGWILFRWESEDCSACLEVGTDSTLDWVKITDFQNLKLRFSFSLNIDFMRL